MSRNFLLTIIVVLTASIFPAFAQNRQGGFLTRPGGALLCPNYSAIKEAKAAAKAVDPKWLASTGCVLAPEGWGINLIDAPINLHDPKMIWYGRVFPHGSGDGVNVYFQQEDVATVAFFDDFFATRDAASHWATINLSQHGDVDHIQWDVFQTPSKTFRITIGPASWLSLTQFCESRKANSRCWLVGQPPN